MNELKNLKNLLLDVLAEQGGSSGQDINALNALKIEQDITAPIIINQSISVLNINIRQRIVKAIKMIDQTTTKPALPEKEIKYKAICECEFPCPVVEMPIDFYAAIEKYQHQLIDLAYEKVGSYNTTEAAYVLGLKRTTLNQMNVRRKKGVSIKNMPSKHPPRGSK